jgi:hypothetical protein
LRKDNLDASWEPAEDFRSWQHLPRRKHELYFSRPIVLAGTGEHIFSRNGFRNQRTSIISEQPSFVSMGGDASMTSGEKAPLSAQSGKGERRATERRQKNIPVAVERRGAKRHDRRRQVDPTTCERDYTPEEIEFMQAMDYYKRVNRRPFPTWSEVLEVLLSLGYRKVAPPSPIPGPHDVPHSVPLSDQSAATKS